MIMTCLLPLGASINFFLPHRVRDGYNLPAKTVQRAARNGYNVIITVDNGVTAFEAAVKAKNAGIDLIITDHHRPYAKDPDAFAIVNPHQATCPYPYKKFAGVGVTFKLMSLLYERIKKELPPKVYELLTLGTIADVVPLTGEAGLSVRLGLRRIQETESLALRILKQNSRVTKTALSSTDIGFSITPQLNALGRLEDARDGVSFLISSHEDKVAHIGTVLKELNGARKAIEKSVLQEIEASIKAKAIDVVNDRLILAYHILHGNLALSGSVPTRLVGLQIALPFSSLSIAKGSQKARAVQYQDLICLRLYRA